MFIVHQTQRIISVLLALFFLLAVPVSSFSYPRQKTLWVPPVPGDVITAFNPPAKKWLPGHRGVDLSGSVGNVVVSPSGGTVTFVGLVVDRKVITITHDDGLKSSVEPVRADVVVGQKVQRGEAIGTLDAGPWHCGQISCLHWGVRDRDRYIDPLRALGQAEPPVLLPLQRSGSG